MGKTNPVLDPENVCFWDSSLDVFLYFLELTPEIYMGKD